MDADERREANEEAVRHFFALWDPAWRWMLVLGLRQMRTDPTKLGAAADAEAGNESWSEDAYAYGPLARGLTAAAVNEVAQYCEDLFALLRSLREPRFFARDMATYRAGQVVDFGRRLDNAADDLISKLFLVPDPETVMRGLVEAENPGRAIGSVEEARLRLGEQVRTISAFYREFEHFHLQYKHGLKLPLRPFGPLSDEAIAERKQTTSGRLFVYTNKPFADLERRPPGDRTVMFHAGPTQQANLNELIGERNLVRLDMTPEIDFDDLVAHAHTIKRLLQLAETNRLALGVVDDDDNQHFSLPGAGRWETVDVGLRLDKPLSLSQFADPPDQKRQRRGRRKR